MSNEWSARVLRRPSKSRERAGRQRHGGTFCRHAPGHGPTAPSIAVRAVTIAAGDSCTCRPCWRPGSVEGRRRPSCMHNGGRNWMRSSSGGVEVVSTPRPPRPTLITSTPLSHRTGGRHRGWRIQGGAGHERVAASSRRRRAGSYAPVDRLALMAGVGRAAAAAALLGVVSSRSCVHGMLRL